MPDAFTRRYPRPWHAHTLRWLAVLLVSLVAAGCASTRVVSEWKSPERSAQPFRKVLVVGVSRQAGVRLAMEDALVRKLKAVDVDAVPSYSLLSEARVEDSKEVESAAKEAGAEAILTTRLVKRETAVEVRPAFAEPPPYLRGFNDWYPPMWVGYYEPPLVYERDIASAETSLYSVRDAQLVWSAATEAFEPRDVRQYAAELANIIVEQLRKQRLV